jgi:phosphoenolpyruvate carboxykinase (GTP)
MAGLNYFLTHENRGGTGSSLLGEKKDVRVWLGWLEMFANGEVDAITTPIGYLPKYKDLVPLFKTINKEYPQSLYDMQFALYVDKIVARLDLQREAYSKEPEIPKVLFEIYETQKKELLKMKEKDGSIITMDKLV